MSCLDKVDYVKSILLNVSYYQSVFKLDDKFSICRFSLFPDYSELQIYAFVNNKKTISFNDMFFTLNGSRFAFLHYDFDEIFFRFLNGLFERFSLYPDYKKTLEVMK